MVPGLLLSWGLSPWTHQPPNYSLWMRKKANLKPGFFSWNLWRTSQQEYLSRALLLLFPQEGGFTLDVIPTHFRKGTSSSYWQSTLEELSSLNGCVILGMPLDFSGFQLLSSIKWEDTIYHLSYQTHQVVRKFKWDTVYGRSAENRPSEQMQKRVCVCRSLELCADLEREGRGGTGIAARKNTENWTLPHIGDTEEETEKCRSSF